jgi:hypothetical protein
MTSQKSLKIISPTFVDIMVSITLDFDSRWEC